VSIDVDVMDMPPVPGWVSAKPNGMTYAEQRDTLPAIAARLDVVGFIRDQQRWRDRVAARR
jgi:agmatinase